MSERCDGGSGNWGRQINKLRKKAQKTNVPITLHPIVSCVFSSSFCTSHHSLTWWPQALEWQGPRCRPADPAGAGPGDE